eukprot:Nk52_evm29s2367 gene=Nk52_evmTU29s2367
MWKSTAGHTVNVASNDDDDWETDADFVNDVSEKEQRWGAKTVEGSIDTHESVDLLKLRKDVVNEHESSVQQEYAKKPQFSYGYGGNFGVQKDRMDKSAVGHDYDHRKEESKNVKKNAPPMAGKSASVKAKFESLNTEAQATQEKERKMQAEREMQRAELERKCTATQKREDEERSAKEQENEKRRQDARKQQEEEEQRAREEEEQRRKEEKKRQEEERKQQEKERKQREEEERRQQQEEERKQQQQERLRLEKEEQERFEEEQRRLEQEVVEPAHEDKAQSGYDAQEPYGGYAEYGQDEQSNAYGEYSEAPLLTARALYEYEADGDDEISFREGDMIYNIDQVDDGWWQGETHDGHYGLFPANYVELTE